MKDPTEVVVIFKTHLRPRADENAYRKVSLRMREIVAEIPGFISIKGYTGEDGEEIDLVRFKDETSLQVWKEHPEHQEAQRRGREEFCDHYSVQACKVVREYAFRIDGFDRPREAGARREGA